MMIDVGSWALTVGEIGVGYLMGSVGKRLAVKKARKVLQGDANGKAIRDAWNDVVKLTEQVPLGTFPCDCQAYSGPEPLPEVISY